MWDGEESNGRLFRVLGNDRTKCPVGADGRVCLSLWCVQAASSGLGFSLGTTELDFVDLSWTHSFVTSTPTRCSKVFKGIRGGQFVKMCPRGYTLLSSKAISAPHHSLVVSPTMAPPELVL